MNTTILQIPIDKSLRNKALSVAQEQGFSSLQDMLRFVLTKFANKQLAVTIQELPVRMSKRAEKTYGKMAKEFQSGKNARRFDTAEALFDDLDA